MKTFKIKLGIFDGNSFKKIKEDSNRNLLTAVWFEVLDLTARCDLNGVLLDKNSKPFTADKIATALNRDLEEVKFCLNYFYKLKMLDVDKDKKIFIVKWRVYQEIENVKYSDKEIENVNKIVNFWYEKGLIKTKLNDIITKKIIVSINLYGLEEVLNAIEIYANALKDEDYKWVDYSWGLYEFLSQKNALRTFLVNGSKRIAYEKYCRNKPKYKEEIKGANLFKKVIESNFENNSKEETELTEEEMKEAEELKIKLFGESRRVL